MVSDLIKEINFERTKLINLAKSDTNAGIFPQGTKTKDGDGQALILNIAS